MLVMNRTKILGWIMVWRLAMGWGASSIKATELISETKVSEKPDNLLFWFLLATVGLLAIIVVIQAWPDKKLDRNQ